MPAMTNNRSSVSPESSRRNAATLLLAAISTCSTRRRPSAPWPRASSLEASSRAVAMTCHQALVAATRAFQSTAPKPSEAAPEILRDGKPALGILLAPNGHGGDEQDYLIDEQAITQSEETGGFKKVLLQKTPTDGFRFVVTQEKMNWQGDWHALFLANAALEGEKLAAALGDAKGKDAKTDGVKVVFKDAWQQPLLVRDPQTSQI